MFEAELNDISLLRDSIATISELIDETHLHIKADGLEMISADRAVVVVVDFAISKNNFSEYKFTKDQKIGINLSTFLNILKRAEPNDTMKLKLLENKLQITLTGNSTRNFVLPLIDISREETPPLDKLEFPAILEMDTHIFNSGIEDADLITDSIVLTVRRDQFSMRAESDSSSTQLEMPSGTDQLKVIELREPVRARYSLDYLKKIIKAKKLADTMQLSLASDYPMKLVFEIPEKIRLSFVLAPRVEE